MSWIESNFDFSIIPPQQLRVIATTLQDRYNELLNEYSECEGERNEYEEMLECAESEKDELIEELSDMESDLENEQRRVEFVYFPPSFRCRLLEALGWTGASDQFLVTDDDIIDRIQTLR